MPSAQKIEIGSSTIFRAVLIILAFWFLYVIRDIVTMLFAAFIIASAIEPIANYAARWRIPRFASAAGVYLVVGGILLGFATLLAQPLAVQAYQLAQSLPDIINQIHEVAPIVPAVDRAEVISAAQDALTRFGRDIANVGVGIFQGTRTVVARIATVVFVLVLAFYFVLEQDAVKKFARLVTPKAHVAYVERVITRAQRGVGRWLLGLIALGTIVGTVIGVGLWIIGVPYALLLGILAGLMEAIPIVGPLLAGLVGVSVALSRGVIIAVVTLILYMVTSFLENNVLVPNVMKRAVGLKPLVILIAVLLGARLGGVAGIILSVPVAVIVSSIASDIFSADRLSPTKGRGKG